MSGSTAPHLIAIAGPSGSGKTSLARMLAGMLPGGGVLLALDAYYRDQRGVGEDAINVDEPAALDHELLIEQVGMLAAGRPVEQPLYDYATHARLAATRSLQPAPWVLVDGLFALYWAEVRDLIHTPLFLDLDHDECLARRIARDISERGRSADAVRVHYERSVRPMYDLHVHPTRAYARLILDARQSIDMLARVIIESLRIR